MHVPGWLLNLAYALCLVVCSPLLVWRAVTQGKYRHGWNQKLWGHVPEVASASQPRIWLHAVSVGEVLQLRQVINEIHRALPAAQVIVSTTTDTGYRVACDKLTQVHVVYFPLDFTWAVRTAIQRLQPDLIILVELELWPNLLRAAFAAKVPVGLINGRLSERSFRGYSRLRWLLAPLLKQLAFVAVQSAEYGERFQKLGVPEQRCHVTGSIKFDGVQTNRDQPLARELREQFAIGSDDLVFIAGSTQAPEEQYALDIYQALRARHPHLRMILVPRHPERAQEVVRLIETYGFPLIRRSSPPTCTPAAKDRAVGLLDTVGELGSCWGLADIAFVGGSFGSRGGQNMLEPAAYGAAVCFGPLTRNFRQIVELLNHANAVRIVGDQADFQAFVHEMLQDRTTAAALGERAQHLVLQHQGATQRTVTLIAQCIGQ